jgi:hypothetical protein
MYRKGKDRARKSAMLSCGREGKRSNRQAIPGERHVMLSMFISSYRIRARKEFGFLICKLRSKYILLKFPSIWGSTRHEELVSPRPLS